jgi:O-antigen ligase
MAAPYHLPTPAMARDDRIHSRGFGPVGGRMRPLAGGPLVWSATLALAAVIYALAIAKGRTDLLLAGGLGLTVPLLFAWRLEAGILAVVVARPSLDLFADSSFGTVAGRHVNPASVIAVLVIAVAVPYMIEHRRDLTKAPATKPYLAFAVIAATGVAVAPGTGGAITEWLRLCSILVTYALAFLSTTSRAAVARLLAAIVLSGVLPALVGIAQFAAEGKRTIGDYSRLTGTFLHPDPYGIYLALVVTVAIVVWLTGRPAHRWFVFGVLLILTTALIGSYTRTAWVMTVISIVLLGLIRFRWLLLAAPVAAAVLVLAVPSTASRFDDISSPSGNPNGPGNSFDSRVMQWRIALPKAERKPLTGLGLATIVEESDFGQHVHSDYVRSLVETGILGFAAYVWLLLATLAGCVRTVCRTGRERPWPLFTAGLAGVATAVCYMVASGDSNLLTQPAVSGTAWAVFACAHAAGRIAGDERHPTAPSRRAVRHAALLSAPGIRAVRLR